MIKQIHAALNNSGNFSDSDLERFKIVLQRYVSGEIGIDDTYNDLLDGDLVPMPSRCSLYTKIRNTTEDEENLRKCIKEKIFNK